MTYPAFECFTRKVTLFYSFDDWTTIFETDMEYDRERLEYFHELELQGETGLAYRFELNRGGRVEYDDMAGAGYYLRLRENFITVERKRPGGEEILSRCRKGDVVLFIFPSLPPLLEGWFLADPGWEDALFRLQSRGVKGELVKPVMFSLHPEGEEVAPPAEIEKLLRCPGNENRKLLAIPLLTHAGKPARTPGRVLEAASFSFADLFVTENIWFVKSRSPSSRTD